MFKIPFGWLPGHWGLSGPIREEARIYYEITDQREREIALAKLKITNKKDLDLALLEIEKKYNRLSDFDYDIKKIEILYSDNPEKYEEEKNELLFKYKLISEIDYERNKANIKKEPWIKIVSEFSLEENGSNKLGFKFEWNEYFITLLINNGYKGPTEESIVEKWFNNVIKISLLESLDEDVIQEYERLGKEMSGMRMKITRVEKDKNRSEYS